MRELTKVESQRIGAGELDAGEIIGLSAFNGAGIGLIISTIGLANGDNPYKVFGAFITLTFFGLCTGGSYLLGKWAVQQISE